MKNKTPILVLTGLAIVAAFGIAGLTREQWMGQPAPVVATPEPAPAEKPATTTEAPATTEKPAATAEAPATAEQPATSTEAPATAEQSAGAPATAEKPATTAEAPPATTEQPATPAETPAPADQTAATTPDKAAEQPAAPVEQPEAAEAPAEAPAAQPDQTASAQPETPSVAETQPAQNAAPEQQVPTFDTVRVEKTGEAVIAGRAAPGSEIVIKLDGQEIGKTVANEDGAFVLVPEKPLPAGSGAMTIEATGKGDLKSVASNESVAVIVPEGQQQQALVAVVSPDAPTKVLQKPEPAAEAPKAAEPAVTEQPAPEQAPAKLVSIDAVDYDADGNIVFSGQGEKGNTARIYVDNNFLGDAPVGDDGRWSYSATANVSQGVHTLRVDGLDAKGSVLNRVEVPIFREEQTKVAAATPPATEQPKTEQPVAATETAETTAPAETAKAEQPAQQPAQTVTEAQKTETPPAAETPAAETPAAEQQTTTVSEQPAKTEETAPGQPAETAAAAAQQETSEQSQDTVAATAPDASAAAAPKEGRIVIQPGNNLWRISRVLYGNGNKFTMLYEANKDQIRNPNLIYPGQVFRTPEVAPKAGSIDPRRRDPLTSDENAGGAQ